MALSLKDLPASKTPRKTLASASKPKALRPWQLPQADFIEPARYELPLPHFEWLTHSTLPAALFELLQRTPSANWNASHFQEIGSELLAQAARKSYLLSCARQKVPFLLSGSWLNPLRIPIPRFLATEQK